VFDVPADLIKRFNGGCTRAGIKKVDDRGRTVDLHSLRKTFNTWLAVAGVAPRVAMDLMCHGDVNLPMGADTDPRLLEHAGAVELLPILPLPTGHQRENQSTDVHQRPKGKKLGLAS
jgi:hypothetical protein